MFSFLLLCALVGGCWYVYKSRSALIARVRQEAAALIQRLIRGE